MIETVTAPIKASVDQQFESLYKIYKLEYQATQPTYRIENIAFDHDPHWHTRWCSVQHLGNLERDMLAGITAPYRQIWNVAENCLFSAGFALAAPRTRDEKS